VYFGRLALALERIPIKNLSNDNATATAQMTAEEKADQSADLKVTLLVFTALVVIAVVTISGWSPQF